MTSIPHTQHPATGIELLQGEYDNALNCIRCGLCLSVCPTYQISFAEEESPRGRIALARALAEGALPVTPDFVDHSQSCLLCEACTAICPAGVKMEPLGVAVRSVLAEQGPGRWRRKRQRLVMNLLLADIDRFRLACRLAYWYQRSGLQKLLRASGVLRLLRLSGAEALLPAMPRRFLKPRGQRWSAARSVATQPPELPPPGDQQPAGRARPPLTALFTGCVMSTSFAETTKATARVLARRGCDVEATAGQGCCGALHLHSGDLEGARRMAVKNLAAFRPEAYDAIVVNSAGCGSTLKGYGHLLPDVPAAAAFAAKVKDFSEYVDSLDAAPSARLNAKATVQEPCHLAHAQRISAQPKRLLRAVADLEVVEMREAALCCGSAGIYNVTNPQRAETLLQRKLDNAAATGASIIVTANPGCLLQLQTGVRKRGLPVQVRHLADVLDEAERAAGG